jgi:hypothetical protein
MENKRLAIFVFEIYLYFKHFNLLKFNAREFELDKLRPSPRVYLFMPFMSLQESIHQKRL